MFGKLMKYEWKYLLRFFLPMWGLVLVLGVVNRFSLWRMMEESSAGGEWFAGVLMMALVLAMWAVCVVAFVVVVQRFYQGLLKDEGYLMFTLPVKSGSLINAKGVTAVLLTFATGVVCILVVLIIASGGVDWSELSDFFRRLQEEIDVSGLELTMLLVWLLILTLVSTAAGVYRIYLALALGHQAKKHRVAWSLAAYMGINIALSALTTAVMQLTDSDWYWEAINRAMLGLEPSRALVTVEIAMTAVYAVQTIAFFFLTRYLLDRRLNLE